MNDRLDHFVEVRAERWLTIAAQRHVLQLQQIARHAFEFGMRGQTTRMNEPQRIFEFHRKLIHIYEVICGRASAAIHFAVSTVEVAIFCWIEVDPERKAAGPR
jgi:hypothetical protein